MSSLLELLEKYGSDIVDYGTDKNTVHSYGKVYEKILEWVRQHKNAAVLEIGTYSGAFVQVMCEYLPECVSIYGIDITNSHLIYKNNRATYLEMDATQSETAKHVNTMFDLIIDDGSHKLKDQLNTLRAFAPFLKPMGMYVMEDVGLDAHVKEIVDAIAKDLHLSTEWVDLRKEKERYDDVLCIFRPFLTN